MNFKTVERAWRRLWIRAVTALLRRQRASAPPAWNERPHRVLFLRHDRIGDMILSTGILRAIAASQPGLELHVLASPANAPILRHEPYVRETVIFDRKRLAGYLSLVRRLRRARYDVVVDCMVTAPSLTTLLLMWASGAPHRVGVASGNDEAFTLVVPPFPNPRHIIEHLSALLAAFGVQPSREVALPTITLSGEERANAGDLWRTPPGTRLLVNISAGTANRSWARDRYVRAVAHAQALRPELRVLITAAPGEADRARDIARAVVGRHVPTAGIRDALALVASADYLLTPDTSIAHAASAFGTPVVCMHRAWTVELWSTLGTNAHNVGSRDETLDTLDVEPVLRALDAMLAPDTTVGPRP